MFNHAAKLVSPYSRRGILIVIAAFSLVAVACTSTLETSATPTESPDSSVGADGRASNAAPLFAAETFNHGEFDLADHAGKPVLINFWFPSCPPCAAELPDMQASYERYGDEVAFIGVQQTSSDTAAEGKAFLDNLGVTYPNFADQNESGAAEVQIAYRIVSYPTTIFLNRDHSISRSWTGLIDEDNLTEQIELVINS